ncbi:MAG: ABC transporter ATP-binding protein/permease [Lachnospiraceae bacterium]|nr:ABC transporter ATP-binding protein/permease [Lachnospiraceae bacterium]
MIRLNNVNKYFFKGKQNEIHVINDISLELPQKGMVALFGHSGCGKTTLLNVIGGLDSIKSGSIEIDGKNIRKNTDDLRNRYIGYIFQNYNLNLKVTNYENVAESLRLCGMEDEETISERVYAALANVGMEKFAHRMPDTLSGGQKQRIAIARAIVKNPAIILADEPTGNLDEANTIVIMDLLKSISKEHLVLLVTHESNLVDYYCDQVIGLKDGKVTEIRENHDANGYVGRDKNVVYLGDYEKQETTLGHVRVSCYGDDLPEEVSVRIVNRDGAILLMCDSPKVKLVDANSEISFREGSFEEEQERRQKEQTVHMETLPPFEGKHFGRLFHWKNALRESAQQIAGPKTKGDKMLKRVMGFFAVIIVLFFAMAGKDIKTYLDAKDSFNHNIFEVRASVDSLKPALDALATKEAGIDSIMQTGAVDFDVTVDLFNTFRYRDRSIIGMVSPMTANGVMLPMKLAEGKKVVTGRGIDELKEGEVLITSFMADKMVESSKMGFIKGRSDLIGLTLNRYRIAGIVEANEPAVYISVKGLYLGRTDRYDEGMDVGRFMKDGFEITDQNRNQRVEVQIHSTDVKATEAFLRENVAGNSVRIWTPDDLMDDIAGTARQAVMKKMATVLIFVLLLSFCMLMIMRGSVMSRVREIGVYRCIGVTRKNMYFRFMVEGLVTASMYILPTYLIMVGIIHWITHCSGMQMEIFLPWWICVPVLIFLYLLAVICALLPIFRMLKKTPAQIMAKYDI